MTGRISLRQRRLRRRFLHQRRLYCANIATDHHRNQARTNLFKPTSCTLADLTMASAASIAPLTLLFQPVLVRCSYCVSPVDMSGVPGRESLLPGGQR